MTGAADSALAACLPRTLPLPIAPGVARFFSQRDLQQAAVFMVDHDAVIPRAESGPTVFPDALQQRIARELERIVERRRLKVVSDGGAESISDAELDPALSDQDYDALIECAPDSLHRSQEMQEVLARIEAAVVASGHQPRRDRSDDRFMSTADEYLEPYFAIRRGMHWGEAANKFNVASVEEHMAAIETWLSTLEVAIPQFNRDVFLARLERAIEKRRKDAIRKGPVGIPAELRVRKRKPQRKSVRIPPAVTSVATTKLLGCNLRTQETERALARARSMPLTPGEKRNRQLDKGLIAIIETTPQSPRRRELVQIVDLTEEGKSYEEIAGMLGISASTVGLRLKEVRQAADCSLCGLQVEDEPTTPGTFSSESLNGVESVSYAEKLRGSPEGAVYL